MKNRQLWDTGCQGPLWTIGVVLITLKLMGKIEWSWGAVTAPFWVPFVIIFPILAIAATIIAAIYVWVGADRE